MLQVSRKDLFAAVKKAHDGWPVEVLSLLSACVAICLCYHVLAWPSACVAICLRDHLLV